MQLIIAEIEYKGSYTIVMGRTTIGTIKGIWKYTESPINGKNYHVELNIAYPNEVSIPKEKKLFSSVCLNNENVIFTSMCDGSDNEVYYLRFDNDWIDMLDIHVITSRKKRGDYISFSANYHDIEIYPYDLS